MKPLEYLKNVWEHSYNTSLLFYTNLIVIIAFMTFFMFSNQFGFMDTKLAVSFIIALIMLFLCNLIAFMDSRRNAENIEEFRNYMELKINENTKSRNKQKIY